MLPQSVFIPWYLSQSHGGNHQTPEQIILVVNERGTYGLCLNDLHHHHPLRFGIRAFSCDLSESGRTDSQTTPDIS